MCERAILALRTLYAVGDPDDLARECGGMTVPRLDGSGKGNVFH